MPHPTAIVADALLELARSWTRLRTAADRRPAAAVAGVWLVWIAGVLVTVVIGLAAGAYLHRLGWAIHSGLWPLFAWDYNWYHDLAQHGYPAGTDGGAYAFFPLWPLLLRASGPIPEVVAAAVLAWAAGAAAFAGVAATARGWSWRSALALACWPGSFALLLGYPDGLALAAAAWAAALALRGRPFAAGALGAVAALARPNGVLIALPLLWLARGRGLRAWASAALPIASAAAVQGYFWEHSGSATVFFHAQRIWHRRGPARVGDWAQHVGDVLHRHGPLIGVAAVVGAVVVVLAWRRFGFWRTALLVDVCAVPVLLLGTHSLRSFVDSARIALVLPLLVVLWRLGPRWRPWAAFATAVVALLLLSGSTLSFGRQALFAFPIFWAIGEGPSWLRKPPLAVLGFAANLALALLLTRVVP